MASQSPPDVQITDAVVLLPGIMGSELTDGSSSVVWGQKLSMSRAFLSHVYRGLAVTPDELEGRPRLRPSRLIARTGLLSLLGAQGPYTELEFALRNAAVDEAAVAPFPYDWRLSIEYNAARLVTFAEEHLRKWKQILAGQVQASDGPLRRFDVGSVKLCFVAHSMGGLVARWACSDPELAGMTRRIISLGTPYWGSAKTVGVMSAGKAARYLDETAVQQLAVTCPGVYDLLPREACVARAGAWQKLGSSDVAAMGGSSELADAAMARWESIAPNLPLPGVELIPISGFTLPTTRRVSINDRGDWVAEAVDPDGYRARGDGTVAYLTAPAGSTPQLQVASHEQLPQVPIVIQAVIRHVLGVPEPPVSLAPPRELGLTAPVTTGPGRVAVRVSEVGVDGPKRSGITVTSATETAPGRWSASVGWAFDGSDDHELLFSRSLAPGVHRITVSGGGTVGVSCVTGVLAND